MKRLLFIILILILAYPAYAIPPFPPSTAGTGDVLAGTMGTTGQYCTKNATSKTIDCNTTPSYQAGLDLVKGTYTNTYLCKYTASGTLLDCNVDPAGFQTAITFGTGTETALASAPDAVGGFLSVDGLGSVTQAYSAILDGLAGVTPANNGIFGYNNSGTLGLYTNHSHDDSAAQFYSATASKGTMKFLLSGSTSGKLLTVAWNHTDDKTLNFPDPTTGDSVTYGSAAIRLDTGGATARVKTISDSADTIVELTQTQTLTNKTLTAPYATLARVDGHTALSPLSAAQVSGTVIRNTGQALADVNHTLPQAAAGYNFIAYVGTTLAATNYWRFTADASPQDYMCLDGTCGKTYVSVDTPTMGDTLTCYTEQMSGTGLKNEADLGIGTSANTSVKNTVAVEFDIAGTGYSKAITETAPGNDVIPSGKYGAVGFEIGADGTIDAIEASDNATGYDSAALAIAGIPSVAASHTRLGTVTATKSDGDFTFGTTALNAANSTVAYTDATVYTPSFGWVCITGKGTWSTD